MAHSWKCSLKSCTKRGIDVTDARVEVRTVVPKSGVKNSAKYKEFLIAWQRNGDAVFHKTCWDQLLKAARGRNPKLSPFPIMKLAEKTMVKEAAKTAERFDDVTTMQFEAGRIAKMIKRSKHCVAFTGAGISTSAGIGDFRGKAGKWTEEDRVGVAVDHVMDSPLNKRTRKRKHNGDCNADLDCNDVIPGASTSPAAFYSQTVANQSDAQMVNPLDSNDDDDSGVPYEDLRPTYTHEALVKLQQLGHLKHIISQNGDGLHSFSGINDNQLSELHGNVFIEYCESCGERYRRQFYVLDDIGSQYYEELDDYGKTGIVKPKHASQCKLCQLTHRTGRKCDKKSCKGFLRDTIINFRDHLEESVLSQAESEAHASDLMLCLGTTMTVTPASDLVDTTQNPQRIVIINRQATAKDNICLQQHEAEQLGSRVFSDCDIIFREVMNHLLDETDLEKWNAEREAKMEIYDKCRGKKKTTVREKGTGKCK